MAEKRDAAGFLNESHGLSVMRSCGCVGLSRAACYRAPQDWTIRDAPVIAALLSLTDAHPRWGFWKCVDRLRNREVAWNHKRLYRVCGLKLNQPRRTRRRLPNASASR
jgi:putative transposase